MSREEGGLGAGSGRALTFQQGSGRCLEGRLKKQQAARRKDHQERRESWRPQGTAVLMLPSAGRDEARRVLVELDDTEGTLIKAVWRHDWLGSWRRLCGEWGRVRW